MIKGHVFGRIICQQQCSMVDFELERIFILFATSIHNMYVLVVTSAVKLNLVDM